MRCDLDGPLPLWVFPAEVGQAEHCQPDRQLGEVVMEEEEVKDTEGEEEVKEKEGEEDASEARGFLTQVANPT